MFHRLNDKGDNSLTEIPGCPEKRIDYNLLLPGAKLHILNNIYRK
jgi:hypothetical protein